MFSSKEIWMTAFEKAFEDGYKRGYIQGRQEALQHCVLALISTMGLSADEAMDMLAIPESDRNFLWKSLNSERSCEDISASI